MSGAIRISVLANASAAKREISGIGSSAEESTSRAKSALKGLATGFLAFEAFDKVKEVLKGAVEQARDAQKTNAQTAAVIKSTGGTAKVSAAHVHEYADALGRMSGQNADTIQGNENLLLTFQNVQNQVGKGNDIFDRATKTSLNMSTALGVSGKSAAKTLGKALNDPVKGLTSLTRVGVQFTAQQTAQIKKQVESGHTLQAQKTILGQLDQKFGGSAKAQATAGAKLKETFRQVEEEIGTKLLPILDKVETYVADHLPDWMAKGEAGVDKVKAAFQTVEPYIETVIGFLKKNPDTVKTFAIVLGILGGAVGVVSVAMGILNAVMAVNPFVLAAIAVAALAAGLVYAYEKSKTFRTIVQGAFHGTEAAGKVFLAVVKTVPKVIGDVIGFVRQHWRLIVALMAGPIGLVVLAIAKNFGKIRDLFSNVIGFVRDVPGRIKALAGNFTDAGSHLISGLFNGVLSAARNAGGFAANLASTIRNAIDDALNLPLTIPRINTHIPGVGTIGGEVLIPRLATGGIVNSPTFALIGEAGPEAVIPLKYLRNQKPTQVNITVNAPVGSDPYTIGETLDKYLTEFYAAGVA